MQLSPFGTAANGIHASSGLSGFNNLSMPMTNNDLNGMESNHSSPPTSPYLKTAAISTRNKKLTVTELALNQIEVDKAKAKENNKQVNLHNIE